MSAEVTHLTRAQATDEPAATTLTRSVPGPVSTVPKTGRGPRDSFQAADEVIVNVIGINELVEQVLSRGG